MNNTIKKKLKRILFFSLKIISLKKQRLFKIEKILNGFKSKIIAIDIGASYFPHVKWGILKRSIHTIWYAIDPNSKNLSYANKWRYKSKINIVKQAVGNKEETRKLYLTNIDSGSSLLKINIPLNSSHRVSHKGLFPIKEKKIKTIPLDKIFNEKIDIPIVIKLDTQGTEFEIAKNFLETKYGSSVLCVELENNILIDPIYENSTSTFEILNYFQELDFEVISLNVVQSVYPKSNKILKSKNIPSECDWVFMKKFESICNSSFDIQVNALKIYITYNLYGEALSLINRIIDQDQISSHNKKQLILLKDLLN